METITSIPWKSAVEESFRELAQTMLPVEIQSVYSKVSDDFSPDLRVTISIQGEMVGKIGLALPWNVTHALTNLFQGVEIPPDPEEIRDVAGELANLIAGGIKKRVREKNGFSMEISVPVLEQTPQEENEKLKKQNRQWILFETNVGKIGVWVDCGGNGRLD